MVRTKLFVSPLSICILTISTFFLALAAGALQTPTAAARAVTQVSTVFTNPNPINPADRASNNAGTNPGIPPVNYPSVINVAGLPGTVTKVTVTFAITTTFPDDFDILLVGPTGARSLVMSDAGGSGDHTNVSFTFDQTAAALMPDGPTTPIPSGTFRPSNYVGFATPEPGGQDNFPMAGGLMSYPTDFNIFNGTNPNGAWNLYVVDDQVIDNVALPSGWSIDITTSGVVSVDSPVDFNADGRTDYVLVRNVGGGSTGQVRWFYNLNNSANPTVALDWGLASDFFFSEDFDNDDKDDVACWRPGPPTVATFYILNSATMTARVEAFGQTGDDPTVVGDYNNDGAADLAVYRAGAAPGSASTWFYRTTSGGPTTYVLWGLSGDFPVPGDFDGDGSADFGIQRNNAGAGNFWIRLATGAVQPVQSFGFGTDTVVPGDYDADNETDLAVVRSVGGQWVWFWRPSNGGGDQQVTFGLSATDLPVQGDYDGDGRIDVAIWRPSTSPNVSAFWTRSTASGAVVTFALGSSGDYPPANYNTH